MSAGRVTLASYQPAVERVVSHVLDGHDTALVAAPGCGLSTLCVQLLEELSSHDVRPVLIDFRTLGPEIVQLNPIELPRAVRASRELARLANLAAGSGRRSPIVFVIDHAAEHYPGALEEILTAIRSAVMSGPWSVLWLGPLDARALAEIRGLRLHALPRSHVCLPPLARDDALAAYRAIAERHGSRWGDAILFLLVDLCGNDLALAAGIAEYLHGNWTDKLYDESVWDRVADWLAHDATVAAYRRRLAALDEAALGYLALVRLGGKPPCHRADLLEEPDDALRRLALDGMLFPNLLPGFYQLRNLTVRYLVDERLAPRKPARLENLFRRATNDRVAQLLQDAEMMLRAVLRSVFAAMSEAEVRTLLESKQGDAELMPSGLNRALLEWAGKQEAPGLRESLNALLVEHRKQFRAQNSVWSRVERMMREDADEGGDMPVQERAVDYLTFAELSDFVVESLERVLPGPYRFASGLPAAKERWRDSLSKIRRLRNRAAHHRNIEFQDMEELAGTIETMRRDLYNHGAWR